MGMSSDWAIELHNEAMENDPEYAAEYESRMDDEAAYYWSVFRPDETAINWFSDMRLAHDGYAEIDCPLCYLPTTDGKACHTACMDKEQWLADLIDEELSF